MKHQNKKITLVVSLLLTVSALLYSADALTIQKGEQKTLVLSMGINKAIRVPLLIVGATPVGNTANPTVVNGVFNIGELNDYKTYETWLPLSVQSGSINAGALENPTVSIATVLGAGNTITATCTPPSGPTKSLPIAIGLLSSNTTTVATTATAVTLTTFSTSATNDFDGAISNFYLYAKVVVTAGDTNIVNGCTYIAPNILLNLSYQ